MTGAPTLAFFDATKPTRLCTDASRQGLGFILQQQSPTGKWGLIQAGSRFLTAAESRYAVIELELLAVAWSVLKCKVFLLGVQNFMIMTDHSPLIPILNSHRLDEIENPRLQRLRTRLMAFSYTAVWCKGSTNKAPDALSRSPTKEPQQEDMLAENDEDNTQDLSISEIRATHTQEREESIRLQELRKWADQNEEYQQLKAVILNGFPNHRSELNEMCKRYWQVRHNLTMEDDLIVYGCRLLIPQQMRNAAT